MSYLVLARKWRPKSFDTLVGQEHVVKALTHALNEQRLHHGYLFTGTRGVGKTTLSRILAKALNCMEGVSANPCGVCSACVGIDQGRFPDYIEMDAASNRGVEEMAHVIEQSVYAPVSGRFKVFMIDEVHMLTHHAFNAMLKTLEEPPEHVKFILATTDPQKIPVTVLSRCLQFSLKNMSPLQVSNHLANILTAEQITFDQPSLRMIGLAARGSMRDALSLTDQAIAHGAGKLEEAAVRSMLGVLDQTYIYRLIDAVINRDGRALIEIIEEMEQRGLSFPQALSDMALCLQRAALLQTVRDISTDTWEGVDFLKNIAEQTSPEIIQLMYTIALHARSDLDLSPDHASGFTMAMIRMMAFEPLTPTSPPTSITGGQTSKIPQIQQPKQAEYKSVPSASTESSTVTHVTEKIVPSTPNSIVVSPQSVSPTTPVSEKKNLPISPLDWTTHNWFQVVDALALTGPARELGLQSEFVSLVQNQLTLRLPNTPVRIAAERFKSVLQELSGQAFQIQWQVGERQGQSLQHVQQVEKNERLAQAKTFLAQDPNLELLKNELGLRPTGEPIIYQ
jgi:DNA polymerase-3 subunit gamma/tau